MSGQRLRRSKIESLRVGMAQADSPKCILHARQRSEAARQRLTSGATLRSNLKGNRQHIRVDVLRKRRANLFAEDPVGHVAADEREGSYLG
jgi:hypothetical protein